MTGPELIALHLKAVEARRHWLSPEFNDSTSTPERQAAFADAATAAAVAVAAVVKALRLIGPVVVVQTYSGPVVFRIGDGGWTDYTATPAVAL